MHGTLSINKPRKKKLKLNHEKYSSRTLTALQTWRLLCLKLLRKGKLALPKGAETNFKPEILPLDTCKKFPAEALKIQITWRICKLDKVSQYQTNKICFYDQIRRKKLMDAKLKQSDLPPSMLKIPSTVSNLVESSRILNLTRSISTEISVERNWKKNNPNSNKNIL